jgi:hypothetical protein
MTMTITDPWHSRCPERPDHRFRTSIAAEILALGLGCVSATPHLKRE